MHSALFGCVSHAKAAMELGILRSVGAVALGAGVGAAAFLVLLVLVPDRWLRAIPRGTVRDADVFVAFGFGLNKTQSGLDAPGGSNLAIALWVVENNPFRKPVIVQEGVYLALKELERTQTRLGVDSWAICLPHDPRVYVNTRGAAMQSWAIMSLKGYHRPALVSHDLQLQRMVWAFEEIGLTDRAVVPDMPTTPFDPASVQHWGTRSRLLWIACELLLARPRAGHYAWAVGMGLWAVAGAAGGWLAGILW